MKNLLLSADGDISLYIVSDEIIKEIDELLNEFYRWKDTDCYDETLFVEFLIKKFGDDCIEFIKIVGKCSAGNYNEQTEIFDNVIEEEYINTKWINF